MWVIERVYPLNHGQHGDYENVFRKPDGWRVCRGWVELSNPGEFGFRLRLEFRQKNTQIEYLAIHDVCMRSGRGRS